MNTQQDKRELEKLLNRIMSDATWYRLRKHLQAVGVKDDEFPIAFQLLAAMNRGRKGTKTRIASIPYRFTDVWMRIMAIAEKPMHTDVTCETFRKSLIAKEDYAPKDRYQKGRYVGINTIWYRWFQSAGISYEKDRKYPVMDLLAVAAHFYAWQEKQRLEQEKKLVDSIFDAEIIEDIAS